MLTRNQLLALRYNPNAMQRLVLNALENYNSTSLQINDASNPFNLLLESAVTTAANNLVETESIIRKKYPNLAVTVDDLYHHLTDNELTSMFSIPAETTVYFFVNILDMKMNGYRPEGANYVETTIPEDTTITILGTPLMLLNDIVVRLYDNNTVFVEQQLGTTDLAYDNVGIINASIVSTKTENVSWIAFPAKVKQLRKHTVTSAVVASKGFSVNVQLQDRYVHSNIVANLAMQGTRTLHRSHTDEYIDPSRATCYIRMGNNNLLNFTIPDVYINTFGIQGNVTIDVYETKGKIYLPINKYKAEEFTVTLGKIGKTKSTASSKNIAIIINSASILEGGSNGSTMAQMQTSIVNNTTGDIDLPITDLQLSRYNEINGYKVFKVSDVITNRLYTAGRDLPDITSTSIHAKQDVFFNTVSFMLEDLKNHYNISIEGDYFIIKAGTIFKLENGSYRILSEQEVALIKELNLVDTLDHFENNTYYYNPYYYVIRKDAKYSYAEVYDLDNPEIKSNRIVGKNITMPQKSNIDKRGIVKTNSGYRVYFTLITNEDFKAIPTANIRVMASIPLLGQDVNAVFYATYEADQDRWYFDIETSHTLDENNTVDLQNGISELFAKRFYLDSVVTIYTYTVDPSVKDPTDYLANEIVKQNSLELPVVFSKEELTISFGWHLKYIWNRIYNSFTERKYRKYPRDIPAVYTDDVYEVFPETGGYFTCTDAGEIKYNILHKKGSPILDDNNQPVLKHRAGDVMLNSDDQPVVDEMSGVIRYVDMLMLEYAFKAATSIPYQNYLSLSMTTLKKYINEDLASINSVLLDNTKILYRSFKSNKPVNVLVGTLNYTLPYTVKPKVTLYMDSDTLSSDTIAKYKNTVGNLINTHLTEKTINLETLRTTIKNTLGRSVAAVKVTGIDPNNSEVIEYRDDDVRLTLNKILELDENNKTIVVYDVDLDIHYV